jgi:hypothetical protein
MSLRLAEISRAVDPGAPAAALLDQAGRRMSARQVVPDDITLLPLPARSPELSPPLDVCKRTPAGQRIENVRRFMQDDRLSNRGFEG